MSSEHVPNQRRVVLVAMLAVVPLAGLNIAASPSHAASPSPAAVVQARTGAAVSLADGGGLLTTVESVTLASGSWTVTSNATAVNFGAGDYVRCQLDVNNRLIDGGATTYLAGRVAGVVNAATWKSSTGFTVALLCEHDHDGTSQQFYFDPGVTLTAMRGGPISSTTVHGSGSPTVVQARTTSSVSVPRSGAAVATAALPAGNWAILAKLSVVDFGNRDYIQCWTSGSPGVGVRSDFPLVGVSSTNTYVADLTVEADASVPSGGGTATLTCATTYNSPVYLDPGATITATLVPRPNHLTDQFISGASGVQLADAGATPVDVATLPMHAGAWRVTTELSAQVGGGFGNDFVRCSLWAGTTMIDGGATVLVTYDSDIQEIVNAGSFTSSAAWTLRLSCSHDHPAPFSKHWFVNGIAVAVNKGPITVTP